MWIYPEAISQKAYTLEQLREYRLRSRRGLKRNLLHGSNFGLNPVRNEKIRRRIARRKQNEKGMYELYLLIAKNFGNDFPFSRDFRGFINFKQAIKRSNGGKVTKSKNWLAWFQDVYRRTTVYDFTILRQIIGDVRQIPPPPSPVFESPKENEIDYREVVGNIEITVYK